MVARLHAELRRDEALEDMGDRPRVSVDFRIDAIARARDGASLELGHRDVVMEMAHLPLAVPGLLAHLDERHRADRHALVRRRGLNRTELRVRGAAAGVGRRTDNRDHRADQRDDQQNHQDVAPHVHSPFPVPLTFASIKR